ncbi:unnamed protein product [Porites lobata]|uniref:Uncharacterized protein n=1 Tax=Porites lobata TaxID=104759 RepID=A0ABN8S7P6_9CNID|nr:unnamed protein product [Porites lobata]
MKRQSTPCLLSDAFNICDGNSAVTSSAANRYVSLEMVLIGLLVIYDNLGAVNLEGAVRVTEVTQSEEACSIPILFTKTDVYESLLSIMQLQNQTYSGGIGVG